MRIIYFAWVRERVGKPEEVFEVPERVKTVSQLIDWLSEKGEGYRTAFSDRTKIRAAVDQTFVGPGHKIGGAAEVAFFPPVTGG